MRNSIVDMVLPRGGKRVQLTNALALVVALILCFNPLWGIHGVESALALGLVLPTLAAFAAVRTVRADVTLGYFPTAWASLGRGLTRAAILWLLAVGLLGLNQFRIRNCSPGVGFLYMVLGPAVGVTLAATLGVLFARFFRSRIAYVAVAFPFVSILVGLYRFWTTPAIFAFDPFAGWFPGTIYDEGLELPLAYLTYRAVTLADLGVVLALLPFASEHFSLRYRIRSLAVAVTFASLSVLGYIYGEELGHRSSVAHIDARLGGKVEGPRCVVHLPREFSSERRAELLSDCEFRVADVEATLNLRRRAKVHAFIYRTVDEKYSLMGAANTLIAKPWRSEVHLQDLGYPHPVLAHEVAHVVAAGGAHSPFYVAAAWNGLLPNPGFIEGIAVAAEWPESDGLDPHEWSLALLERGKLPRLASLMSLAFLAEPPRQAYAAAGSFVRFALSDLDRDRVIEAHRHGDLSRLGDTRELERQWHRFLRARELSERDRALAELRFAPGSIFSTTCPHVLAMMRSDLAGHLASGDSERVLATCSEMLAVDRGELSALLHRPAALAWTGHQREVTDALAALQAGPAQLQAIAKERVADAYWSQGRIAEARQLYEELLNAPQTRDEARNRELKRWAVQQDHDVASLIGRLLAPRRGIAPSESERMGLAEALSERVPTSGLGDYLAGRQLYQAGSHDLAMARLLRAQELGLPTEGLTLECTRLLALNASLSHNPDARDRWRALLEHEEIGHEANDWLRRLQFLGQ